MDTEFRQRKPLNENNNNLTAEDAKSNQNENVCTNTLTKQDSNFEGFESDEECILGDKTIDDIKTSVPQSTDRSCLDKFLDHLPQKWKNYVVRSIFTFFMVFGFFTFIYLGPLALAGITIFVQVKCFSEIISVGYAVYKVHGLPWFRSLSWYFLVTSNYFFYGESFSKSDFFDVFILKKASFLYILVKYHRFISFSLYIMGILWFVLSLKKRYYMRQFSLFAWTHVTLLIVVTQSYLILQNLFQGLIWFIAPVSMIVINDVMAYLFGFFFGKTPLIKLSPKKTWEGFIGGGISTVILGALLSHALCKYPYFVCPVEYTYDNGFKQFDCRVPHLFQPTEYDLPIYLSSIFKIIKLPRTITLYPFVLHSLSLSTFSSIIAPFGGFFASGFKRAFKIKDFGDIIPGHGGIMDRFDCQFLMATFVNVYISSFISAPNPDTILQSIYQLKPEHQIIIFESLKKSLQERLIV